MTKRLGPRFGIEAGFLIGVAVVLGLLEVSWPAIVAAMAIAWLVVAGAEVAVARSRPAEGPVAAEPEPMPTPDVFVAPPAPVLAEPEPEPEPEPEAAPEPEPEPALPPPEPPAATLPEVPREWNLGELERIAREHAGADPARDEERSYLLLSLRDFAKPDGNLPVEFDQLVRDAFGDLVRTAA